MLHNGLYEQIINKGLDAELSVTDKLSQTAPIDSAEASKVLSKYVAEIVEKGLNNVKDNGGNLTSQVELVNRIVSTIMTETKEADFDTLSVAERAEQLLALFDTLHRFKVLFADDIQRQYGKTAKGLQLVFCLRFCFSAYGALKDFSHCFRVIIRKKAAHLVYGFSETVCSDFFGFGHHKHRFVKSFIFHSFLSDVRLFVFLHSAHHRTVIFLFML